MRLDVTRLRRLLWPGIMTLVMLAVLIGLGTWQVERLAWKRAILRQIDEAESTQALPLGADPAPFAKVRVEGRLRTDLYAFYGAEERDTREGPQLGAQLITPLERPGGPTLLVNRGWVPLTTPAPIETPSGPVSIEGYVRPAQKPGLFSATDNPAQRRFFTLDPHAIGAALGLDSVAPFTLIALGSPPAEGYPDPARNLPRPPNNHLSYALTWYALALTLIATFVVWAREALGTE